LSGLTIDAMLAIRPAAMSSAHTATIRPSPASPSEGMTKGGRGAGSTDDPD
jgi:hypothetical protein